MPQYRVSQRGVRFVTTINTITHIRGLQEELYTMFKICSDEKMKADAMMAKTNRIFGTIVKLQVISECKWNIVYLLKKKAF